MQTEATDTDHEWALAGRGGGNSVQVGPDGLPATENLGNVLK